jgi:hypothetical protein
MEEFERSQVYVILRHIMYICDSVSGLGMKHEPVVRSIWGCATKVLTMQLLRPSLFFTGVNVPIQ